jgi:hypothetical protein
MLLFWAMFLPLERRWSLDHWLDKRRGIGAVRESETRVLSVASAAILLQMALMYFFSAIAKSNEQWFRGEALAGILASDVYGLPPAAFLLQFPKLLALMTRGVLVLEWAAPFLLFLFAGTARLRLGILAALAAMHVAIGVCLEVGLFSWVSLAGLVLFLPEEFWNSRPLARFSRPSGSQLPEIRNRIAVKRPQLFLAAQGFCLVALLYVFAVNINTLPGHPLAPWSPEQWRPLTRGLGLSQGWSMFAAIPSKDGWYVARAKLKDGSEVDLLRGGAAVDWQRPEFPARLFPNYFWHKLFREMAYFDEQGFQVFRTPVAEFLCRDWNGRNALEKQVAEFEFVFCSREKTTARGATAARILREQLVHLNVDELE